MVARTEKRCFKCGECKLLDEFYKHSEMADGHLNKCKECTKKDVANRYQDPRVREVVIAYERRRSQTPERKAKRVEYQRRARKRHPNKDRARRLVNKAIRSGRLVKKSCSVCGLPDTEAHHTDYEKPLDVVWLCFKHHREAHGQITT